jgi:hypothetical protein
VGIYERVFETGPVFGRNLIDQPARERVHLPGLEMGFITDQPTS